MQKTLVHTSLKDLEDHLPNNQFMRVHKSFIISLTPIAGIEGNVVKLKNVAAVIQIGDNYKSNLMAIVKNKMIH